MSKYHSRTTPISRDDEFTIGDKKAPSWFDDFVDHFENNIKTSKSDNSAFDQINSILGNNKSKYSSVEEAVLDFQKRTGLFDFLQNKQASEQGKVLPAIFKEIPDMKIFIDNFVADRPGTSIESVVHELLRMDRIRNAMPKNTDIPDDVKKYINDRISEIKTSIIGDTNNLEFGKSDTSDTEEDNDPLAVCEPFTD